MTTNLTKWATLLACFFLAGCAGMGPAETTATVAAGSAALVGIIDALSPYLPPEKIAELSTHVGNATTMIEAIMRGVQAVAQVSAQAKVAAEHPPVDANDLLLAGSGAAATALGAVRLWRGPSEVVRKGKSVS